MVRGSTVKWKYVCYALRLVMAVYLYGRHDSSKNWVKREIQMKIGVSFKRVQPGFDVSPGLIQVFWYTVSSILLQESREVLLQVLEGQTEFISTVKLLLGIRILFIVENVIQVA